MTFMTFSSRLVAHCTHSINYFEYKGLVVARLGDHQHWSAPCAIGMAGLSWGALIGAQVSDHVFLLMTDAAVELMFNNDGNLQLGADIGVVSLVIFLSSNCDVEWC